MIWDVALHVVAVAALAFALGVRVSVWWSRDLVLADLAREHGLDPVPGETPEELARRVVARDHGLPAVPGETTEQLCQRIAAARAIRGGGA